MNTKTTAVSLSVVLLVAAGVAGGYSSCGSSSSNPPADGGRGGTGGNADAAGTGGAHDGGTGGGGAGGAGGTGNCGGNFAPTDAGPPDGATLKTAVQVILDAHCTSCHTTPADGGATALPQSLDFTNISTSVGRISTQCGPADGGADAGPDASVAVTGKQIVDPNHPEISYLVDKVIGHAQNCGCFSGAHQPPMCDQPDSGQTCLSTAEVQLIVNWIATGAQ